MPGQLIPVKVLSSLPYDKGAILFLSDSHRRKIVSLKIDGSVGYSISLSLAGETAPRPLTHDITALLIKSFGGRMDRLLIREQKNGVYYTDLIFSAENEVMHKKIVNLDSRPGDGIALALRLDAPIYISHKVWEEWKDDSSLYELLAKEIPDSLLS